nr:MAG TPA: hypothetical protein [Caudoviricetes sp.]
MLCDCLPYPNAILLQGVDIVQYLPCPYATVFVFLFSFFKKALQVGKYGLFSFVISVKNALRICGQSPLHLLE